MADSASVRSLSDNLLLTDLYFRGRQQAIASYTLTSGGETAIVETGPSTTISSLTNGLAQAGVSPLSVSKILLTHIHLDHAGATGSLMELLPNAVVYVSEVGAPHLADPSKLVGSASRIYGDQMEALWGEVLPVPEDRLRPLADGAVVRVGDLELHALYTPGHASHHLAYWVPASGAVFTGDAAGVRLPGTDRVLPPTPPPDLDLEEWDSSIERILGLHPSTMYLTHFGGFHDAERHLSELRARLFEWRDLLLDGARRGLGQDELALLLERHADAELSATVPDPEVRGRYGLVAGYGMDVAGFLRYFRKRGDLPG